MYMPGRSRTGSSPSRTVMSFAVYVVSAMKKALQTSALRAHRSLPERPVVTGLEIEALAALCEACRGGAGDELAQLGIGQRRRQLGGCRTLPRAGLRSLRTGALG